MTALHPGLARTLAWYHQAERHRQAGRHRVGRLTVTRTAAARRSPLRGRLGWTLVEIGLRLASGTSRPGLPQRPS